jgi:arginyl-tRNA synthetase
MKTYLRERILAALAELGLTPPSPPGFEAPRDPSHGDLTSNVAMLLAKAAKRNPRQLAQELVGRLALDPAMVAGVEVAGPGFINFRIADGWYRKELAAILADEAGFGRSDTGKGKRALVEFVSANPTGPLTVGHGRNAVLGDTLANLLSWTGHEVEREYYFNDAGRQMRILGDSVRLRYLELLGEEQAFPEDYYQGEYIREIAAHLKAEHGDALRGEPAEGKFKERAEEEIFEDIKGSLGRLGIRFDTFFNEHTLYRSGAVTDVVEECRTIGLVYDREGAVWFRASALGGEKDKVFIKSSGEPTYRLPDIAYHREKFRRGYDLMVDVFGADHIATYPDVLAALKALGYDASRVRVVIYQFVTLVKDGEAVKMSTRKANFVTLDDLVAEVGPDVVRYFFVMRGSGTHLAFDIGLARQQSEKNPVYYLQYAHARISSLLRYAAEQGKGGGSPDLGLLTHPAELELMKELLRFPGIVAACAAELEPHWLPEYLNGLAGSFHKFFHECRVVTEDEPLTNARLALCRAVRAVLRNGFAILGVTAPEQM